MLEQAERPVVLTGGGAHWSRAGAALRAFTERTGIPVTTTSAARGLLPDTHPNCLGYLMHGGIAVTSADVVLILGSKFNANLVYGRAPLFMDGVKIVHVDVLPEHLGGARAADVAIASDVRLALEAMTNAWTARPDRFDEHRAMAVQAAETSRNQWRGNWENAATTPVHPGRLAGEAVAAAREVCGEDVTFVADGGDSLVWAIGTFPAFRPQGLHTSTSLGTLGVGVPFANAAAIAHGTPVVAVFGDGAFGLAAMEVDTAVRFGLPVVLCISNNAAWGDVRHEAENWFGKDRVVAADLRDTDYAAMARALGAHGERVDDADEMRQAVVRALETNGPAVVDVKTDPEVVSDLLKEMAQLGLM
jgi:acetolactate synthase-1/2/3 large subunit